MVPIISLRAVVLSLVLGTSTVCAQSCAEVGEDGKYTFPSGTESIDGVSNQFHPPTRTVDSNCIAPLPVSFHPRRFGIAQLSPQ